MNYITWLCIFTTTSIGTFGQTRLDSLKTLLSNVAEPTRSDARLLSEIAYEYFNAKIYDSALSYYKSALAHPKNVDDRPLIGHINLGIGVIYNSTGKFDSSIHYYNKALQDFTYVRDTTNAITTELNLSIAYKNIGLYNESLTSALAVLSRLESNKPTPALASIYNNIGTLYLRTKTYKEAEKMYRLSLRTQLEFGAKAEVSKAYNNLGELFITTRQYDSARTNLERSARIKRELRDTKGLARTLNNIGRVEMLTGNNGSASRQFNEVLAMQEQIDDPVGMIEVLNNLGELHLSLQRPDQARKYLQRSEALIQKAGTPEYLRQNLELQIKADRMAGDPEAGIRHLQALIIIKDSLLSEDKARSLQAMQIRYETEKKEQQINLLQQREQINNAILRNNQILIVALVVGLLLATSVGVLVYINLRNARSSKRHIELLLEEQRHRIKNNLQTLASIFNLQTHHYTDSNMIMEARNSESRVHAMALLHEKLYSHGSDNNVELKDFITELADKLVSIYGFKTDNLKLEIQIDQTTIDIDKAMALGLIIQELVCNAFKYAFDNIEHPHLEVVASISGKHDITVTVSDNGVGLDENFRSRSHGLGLVDALVEQLRGKIEVIRGKGTTFKITFPIIPVWKKHSF